MHPAKLCTFTCTKSCIPSLKQKLHQNPHKNAPLPYTHIGKRVLIMIHISQLCHLPLPLQQYALGAVHSPMCVIGMIGIWRFNCVWQMVGEGSHWQVLGFGRTSNGGEGHFTSQT